MNTVIKVMESLTKMNGWTVARFDIQHYNYNSIEGYVGYLDVNESDKCIIIRHDGSFEYKVN